jgi:hypothetical protein
VRVRGGRSGYRTWNDEREFGIGSKLGKRGSDGIGVWVWMVSRAWSGSE